MSKIVKNDGKDLVRELGLDEGSLKHEGNFRFTATKDGDKVEIYTSPVDDECESINIIKVYIIKEVTAQINPKKKEGSWEDIEEELAARDMELLGYEEEYRKCEWCEEYLPISEMRKEKDFGYICERCQRAIASRGEQLTYED